MVLQKQIIPVQFDKGINTKIASQLLVGQFDLIENGIRSKYGRIDKRTGYTRLPTAIIGSTTALPTGIKIDSYFDQLLTFDGFSLYAYSTAAQQWINRGAAPVLHSTTWPIVRNNAVQTNPSVAYNNGIAAYIYTDSRGGVRLSVSQQADNSPIISDQQLSTTGVQPKAIAIGVYIYLLYRETANMVVKRISTTAPSTVESISSALVSNMSTTANGWDVDSYDTSSSAIVVYATSTATKIFYLLVNGTIGTSASGYPNLMTIAQSADQFITVKCDSMHARFWVSTWDSALNSNLRLYGISADFLVTNTNTVATYNLGDYPYPINASIVLSTSTAIELYYTLDAGDARARFIRRVTYTWPVGSTPSVTVALADFKLSVSLASKVFIVGTERYMAAFHSSTIQPTLFILRGSDAFAVAREFAGEAAATDNSLPQMLSDIPLVGTNGLIPAVVVGKQIIQDGEIIAAWRGIHKIDMETYPTNVRSVTIGNTLHTSGALLQVYDGQSAVEDGFNLYPEVTAHGNIAAGSLNADSTYYFAALYEWVDARGQVHRSAPSIVGSQTTVGANRKITVTVTTLRLTRKTSPRAEVKIVLYRGIAGDDTILYRDQDTANSTTTNTVTFTVTQADSAVTGNELIYTTGGVLENLPPPPSAIIAAHKNRIWLAGLEDPNQLAYSRAYTPGESMSFNDGQRLQVDPAGGEITALASLDDKLIVFKQDRIFALVGDGPTDTGQQNDYTSPQLITSDVGCNNPESIIFTPKGLMFKSDKGIRLLDRTLGVLPNGQEMDDYSSLTITSAILLGDQDQVRFTTLEGTALIYNYNFDQWSTYTNYESLSACRTNTDTNNYFHLDPDGRVLQDNSGYLDDGARIKMAIETSWLAFAGLQGYQRVYRFAALGDFISDHYTVVKLAYDYERSYNETIYFNVDEGLDLTYYGDDATYGDSKVYGRGTTGEASGVYQFSCKPRQQKCEAMKLRIEDIDTKTAAGGGSFNFVALSFEVGTKGTLDKLDNNKRIGSG